MPTITDEENVVDEIVDKLRGEMSIEESEIES